MNMKAKPSRPHVASPNGHASFRRGPLPVEDKVECKFKPLKEDLLNFIGSQHSISELSFCVNDSAGDTTFDDTYVKQEVLGEGGFAIVYRCVHLKRKHKYAVKIVENDKYECSGENLREELDALRRLKDVPYIVRLLDVFQEPDRTYMIMEEMKGGDLLDRLCEKEVYTEDEARRTSRKLLEAIFFCHKKRICHRDIKPENILLTSKDNDCNIKLADFGCAKHLKGDTKMKTLCGSPQYVAPELYMNEDGYDERCDLWSAGVVIFILLGGYAPFDGPDEDLPSIICDGWFTFHDKYWSDISRPPKDLIKGLLQVEADDRISLEKALDSEWLKRRDRESISKFSMDGSVSNFNAWIARANDSSQSVRLHEDEDSGRLNDDLSSQSIEFGESPEEPRIVFAKPPRPPKHPKEQKDDDMDNSSRSLSIADLMLDPL